MSRQRHSGLSSRAIIGAFFLALEQRGSMWTDPLMMKTMSDQASEEYKWLGMAPMMREWIGGRQAKGLRENGFTVENKKFEATLEVSVDDIRRDKTDQIMLRVRDLARRTADHPAKLMSDLLLTAETALCYDGQAFFDTDHSEGDSGTISNDLSFDIDVDGASVPSAEQGTTTAPGVGVMELAILNAIQAMFGFKDDQGEPLNQGATDFMVMVPVPFWTRALAALRAPVTGQGRTNTLVAADGFNINLQVNPRLTWTTKFAVFRTDAETKPFFWQEELPVEIAAVAEGSELEFDEDIHRYGVKAINNVGFGFWQHACLTTLV